MLRDAIEMKGNTMRLHRWAVLAIALGGVVLGGWVCHRFLVGPSRPSEPRIEVERVLYLGERDLSVAVEVPLQITNGGEETLVIQDVETHCGCLGVFSRGSSGAELQRVTNLEIPGGSERMILLRLAMNGVPGAPQVRRVGFRTNDPANPVVEVAVHAVAKANYLASPQELNFGSVPGDMDVSRTIELRATSRELPAISKVVSASENIQIEFLTTREKGQSQDSIQGSEFRGRILVSTRKQQKVGAFAGSVLVNVEDQEAPVLNVPVSGKVVPVAEFSPGEFFLPRKVGEREVFVASCLCRAATAKQFGLRVVNPPEGVVVRITEVPENPVLLGVHLDATRLAAQKTRGNHPFELSFTATVDGREVPVALKVWIRSP